MQVNNDEMSPKNSCNFLVVAALQEELKAFYKVTSSFNSMTPQAGDAYEVEFVLKEEKVKILTYTPNKMGMPFNAAAIMNIINLHNPTYTFMIGTCAGLIANKRQAGDVLVPHRIFSYESGKYEKGEFLPDHLSLETGQRLRKHAELIRDNSRSFQVFTDEDFLCGAAVINDEPKRKEIINNAARKARGLDMESYAIACINSIVNNDKELLVIKGISDFAIDKGESEVTGNKELAIENSAKFAFELIIHLQTTLFKTKSSDTLKEIMSPFADKNILQLGSLISLKGSNGYYVSSENGKLPMNCNRREIGAWEKFSVEDAGNGLIALKNNGKYISSEDGKASMTCNRMEAGSWEKFNLVYGADGKVAFKGNNARFISSQKGLQEMTCNSLKVDKDEEFDIITHLQVNGPSDSKRSILLNDTLLNSDIKVFRLKRWENNVELGDRGEGDVNIDNGIINIHRTNDDGRILIKVHKYLESGQPKAFVSKRSDVLFRILNVTFKAKVTNGEHKFFVICKHTTEDKWINEAFLEIKVDTLNWKEHHQSIRVPGNYDFFIDLVDRDVKGSPSTLLVKDLIIYE